MTDSILKPTNVSNSGGHALWLALAAAFAAPIFTWYVLYPQAGYQPWTLNLSLLLTLLVAAGFVSASGPGWRRIGLGGRQLGQALLLTGLAYALILGVGLAANAFGANLRLFRDAYSFAGLFENWLLVGLGEELLFCGVLFWLVAARLPRRKRWLAVVLVAVLFALWHLPGYLAQGRPAGQIAGWMSLNLVSWMVFGTVYALSGNLWLAAFTHASTDYGLSPMVTDQPLVGLVFMAFLVFAAWQWSMPRRSRA
jgi:membrane protease YdiL (CAAX protease family)